MLQTDYQRIRLKKVNYVLFPPISVAISLLVASIMGGGGPLHFQMKINLKLSDCFKTKQLKLGYLKLFYTYFKWNIKNMSNTVDFK